MPHQLPQQILQMPQQQQKSLLGSLFQLAAPFANTAVPGLGTALGGVGSMMNGGGAGGLAQGVQQLTSANPGQTPPIQPPANATPPADQQKPPEKQDNTPKPPAQPLGQPQGGGTSQAATGQQQGMAAQPSSAAQIPDPLEAQRKQEQQAALQSFIQQNPELFSLMSQSPHYLEGLVSALQQLHGHITQPQQPQNGGMA